MFDGVVLSVIVARAGRTALRTDDLPVRAGWVVALRAVVAVRATVPDCAARAVVAVRVALRAGVAVREMVFCVVARDVMFFFWDDVLD